jgi:hypothetical protein
LSKECAYLEWSIIRISIYMHATIC